MYYLRFISDADCTHIVAGSGYDIDFGLFGSYSGSTLGVDTDKTCALLKASFAFGIMECIFFSATAVLAYFHGGRMAHQRRSSSRYYRETHYARHGHRRRSSRASSHRSRSRRRSGSRRSSHSHRRVYV